MKKAFFFLIVLIIVLIFLGWNGTRPERLIANLSKKGPITTGTFRYRLYAFGVLPLGEAEFVKPMPGRYHGQNTLHLHAAVESFKAFAWIFQARAAIDSYLDTITLNPFAFTEKIKVGSKPEIGREVAYDQKNRTMTLEGVKRVILADTQDPLSLIYNLQRWEPARLKNFEMNLNTKHKNYIVTGLTDEKTIFVQGRPYDILIMHASVKRRDGNPYHQSKVMVVFLKDKINIPLLIKISASGFPAQARLIETR